MSDEILKNRGLALEEEYYKRMEDEAVKRLSQRMGEKPRLSPITGKPMVQKSLNGVIIDQCEDSKGIWLDAGELDQILKIAIDHKAGVISRFFSAVLGRE